jgi:nitrite reductase/ring-hydroxylating ferredoxin subunit
VAIPLLSRLIFALRHRTLGRVVLTGEGADARVIVHYRGRTTTLKRRCPHQGAPLELGYLEEGCLVCPWHGCRFPLRSSEATPEPTPSWKRV